MQTSQEIPLHKLFLSPLNQRQSSENDDLSDILPTIAAQGVLQELVVVAAAGKEKRGTFGVVAGGRRLRCLNKLVETGAMTAKAPIRCLIIDRADAIAASITENVSRKAMNAVDEFLAFKALVDSGVPVEDVAAQYGVTPLVVRRRLKLCSVSPRLLDECRQGKMTLEQLTALAGTDDHTIQEGLWFDRPHWQRDADEIRGALSQGEVIADTDKRVLYVGLDAYKAAGGSLRVDLFDDHSGYLQDLPLLDQLVRSKMEADAEALRAEGWGEVELIADMGGFSIHSDHLQMKPTVRAATKAETTTMQKLQKRMDEIESLLEEEQPDDEQERLETENDALIEAMEAIEAAQQTYTDEQRKSGGVVLSLNRQGTLDVFRGYVRRSTYKPAADSPSRAALGLPEKPTRGVHSEKLVQQLTAHRTAALQVIVAEHPQYGLAVLLDSMVSQLFGFGYQKGDAGLQLSITGSSGDLKNKADDMETSPAHVRMAELRAQWAALIPGLSRDAEEQDDGDEPNAGKARRLLWLMEQDQQTLLSLLSFCVASGMNLVCAREERLEGIELARQVGLDMTAFWSATAGSYFTHVAKSQVLQAASECGAEITPALSSLKKDEAVAEVERLIAGKNWLPSILRAV